MYAKGSFRLQQHVCYVFVCSVSPGHAEKNTQKHESVGCNKSYVACFRSQSENKLHKEKQAVFSCKCLITHYCGFTSDVEMHAEPHAARRDRNTKANATNSKPQFQKVPGATKVIVIDSATKTRPIVAKIRRRLRLWSFMYAYSRHRRSKTVLLRASSRSFRLSIAP